MTNYIDVQARCVPIVWVDVMESHRHPNTNGGTTHVEEMGGRMLVAKLAITTIFHPLFSKACPPSTLIYIL
jgi:hypothetical protein